MGTEWKPEPETTTRTRGATFPRKGLAKDHGSKQPGKGPVNAALGIEQGSTPRGRGHTKNHATASLGRCHVNAALGKGPGTDRETAQLDALDHPQDHPNELTQQKRQQRIAQCTR